MDDSQIDEVEVAAEEEVEPPQALDVSDVSEAPKPWEIELPGGDKLSQKHYQELVDAHRRLPGLQTLRDLQAEGYIRGDPEEIMRFLRDPQNARAAREFVYLVQQAYGYGNENRWDQQGELANEGPPALSRTEILETIDQRITTMRQEEQLNHAATDFIEKHEELRDPATMGLFVKHWRDRGFGENTRYDVVWDDFTRDRQLHEAELKAEERGRTEARRSGAAPSGRSAQVAPTIPPARDLDEFAEQAAALGGDSPFRARRQ